jgi:hypothetical protein
MFGKVVTPRSPTDTGRVAPFGRDVLPACVRASPTPLVRSRPWDWLVFVCVVGHRPAAIVSGGADRFVQPKEEPLPPGPLALEYPNGLHLRHLADAQEAPMVVTIVRVQDALHEAPLDSMLQAAPGAACDLNRARLLVGSPFDE